MRLIFSGTAGLAIPVLLTGCLLLVPRSLRAEEEVQRVYRQAVEQFQEGHYDRALTLFTAAYEGAPVPRILRDIAMCHRVLGNIPASVNNFRLYFHDEDPARITPEQRAQIEQLLAEMRQQHGDIAFEVTLPGATLLIDHHEVGFSPLTDLVAVTPGRHTVIARRNGYTEARIVVTVGRGESVTARLSPTPIRPAPDSTPETPAAPENEPIDEDEGTEVTLDAVTPAPIAAPSPSATRGPPSATPSNELGWWFWTSVAIAGVTGVAAVVTGGLMLRYRSDYVDGGSVNRSEYETTGSLALSTDILIGIAAGTALITVIELIVYYARRRSRVAANPGVASARASEF